MSKNLRFILCFTNKEEWDFDLATNQWLLPEVPQVGDTFMMTECVDEEQMSAWEKQREVRKWEFDGKVKVVERQWGKSKIILDLEWIG